MRFLLVDAIRDVEPGVRATGIKNVTLSEDFLAEHFPDRPIMPGVMILEALVQLADWLIRSDTDFEMLALPASFERIRFRRMVRPGDQLRLDVEMESRDGDSAVVKAKAYTGDTLVASTTIGLTLEPLASYLDPDEARRLFALLNAHAEEVVP
jgi:3-hydroxyacyl-[acyl-carrier-protein] dehydratase